MKRVSLLCVGIVLAVLWLLSPVTAFAQAGPAPQGAPSNPHARSIPQDLAAQAPDLPKGVIEAIIVGGDEQPLPGTNVRLGVMYQSVAEGESRSEKFARTDPRGLVRFEGLSIGAGYSYRVTLKSGEAEYSSMPIALPENMGYRVRLHVFPVTNELGRASVGMRNIVFIETRDDVFQFQVMYRVFNVGGVTWVPRDVGLRLPSGFKAFSADKGMTDARFEVEEGRGVKLRGTFAPGQHDVSFRFQMPKNRDESAFFSLGVLPHLYEMRVLAAASPTMKLDIAGFETPQVDQLQNGQRVLVTRRLMSANDTAMTDVTIGLSGLPVPGPGRWIAACLAALLALSGFGAAYGYLSFDAPGKRPRNEELAVARELLLEELVVVERARQAGELGPRAHTDARKMLLGALARLGPEALETSPAKRRSPGSKRSKASAERPIPPSTG